MTYGQLSLGQCAAALLLLAIGVALMLIAQRRDWRPSMTVAICIALVLRLVMLALAWRTQPYDLANDFQTAGWDVLHHQDPILNNRPNGWGSLPPYAFVLAGAYWGSVHLHVSWLIIARIPAILSDLGVVVLVGMLAGAAGERAALRRLSTPAARWPPWSASSTARPSLLLPVLPGRVRRHIAGGPAGLRPPGRRCRHPVWPGGSRADVAGGVRPGLAAGAAGLAPPRAVRGRSRRHRGAAVHNAAGHRRYASRQAALHRHAVL